MSCYVKCHTDDEIVSKCIDFNKSKIENNLIGIGVKTFYFIIIRDMVFSLFFLTFRIERFIVFLKDEEVLRTLK